ncbi:hypothetical protein NA56DRAFT_647729 [Hyaloscypha hepaticicola]|uniref:S-adenosyl-L-methionine-dependent methyltransferase n=1 Tax=Hyaloscypha hepaticicola TaxID=2082293 RepID=A0A2J6PXU8_9HELO|nr:hypothetical protein NA56DRAFT_647729 [Hyaloscypha hepaticicola]
MPGSFVFDFEVIKVTDAIKGIGNSVPVTVSCALGYEVLKVLVDMHEKQQQRSDHLNGKGSKDDPITLD